MVQGTTLEKVDTFKPFQTWKHDANTQEVIKTQPWKAIWPPRTETSPKEEKPRYPALYKLPSLQAAFGYSDASEAHPKNDSVADMKE
ncbi:hypothetical protein DL770_009983 [Monosporascus sp. CRB-9-2]|nr:hypothetical protein DL770_009983 [Monosporascus sp. CRB-9-2]